jgi:hypothetical protein
MHATLCFIDAANVQTPGGLLRGFRVRDTLDRNLGRLEGFVLDPGTRRLRFLVVACKRWLKRQSYLVPLRTVQVDQGNRAMLVDLDRRTPPDEMKFDPTEFPVFSDEHLLQSMFGSGDR